MAVKTKEKPAKYGKPMAPPPGAVCQEVPAGAKAPLSHGVDPWFVVRQADGQVLTMCEMCADHNVKNRGAKVVLFGETVEIANGGRALNFRAPASPEASLPRDAEVEEAPAEAPSDAALSNLATLVALVPKLEKVIEEHAAAGKELNLRLAHLTEVDLPNAMIAAGYSLPSKVKIAGLPVEFKEAVSASITVAKQAEGFAYLEAENADDMIKHDVKLTFGKGEEKFFEKVVADLGKRKNPPKIDVKHYVSPQTLGAWVRERFASGLPVNEGLLGVYRRRYVAVKGPTAARGDKESAV